MLNKYSERLFIFGEAEDNVIEQMENCLLDSRAYRGILAADNHLGYSQPVGGAIGYMGCISPKGVGYDIACGNKAVCTDMSYSDIEGHLETIMNDVVKHISFGVGRVNNEKVDHELFESNTWKEIKEIQPLKSMARDQLGTVGSGNHFVDIFVEEATGKIWIGVHFGSRGLGHKIATGFLNLAAGIPFGGKPIPEKSDDAPTLLNTYEELGQTYLKAMELAGEYAYAGRDWAVDKVLSILGAKATYEVHNHHNFAWKEEHDGQEMWVVRKGATPCFPNQEGFIGSTMCDNSVIIRGKESDDSKKSLYSTVHGAGRVMSRMKAKGKFKKRTDPDTGKKFMECIREPAVTDGQFRKAIKEAGIVLRGGGVDESPFVYKKLEEVLKEHDDTLEVLHTLRPIGVAMAGANEFDPYRD